MKKLSAFFSLASGVFAVVPGMTVLISNMGVPPGTSKTLFAATIEALGVLTLMLLILNKTWVENMSLRRVTKMAGLSIFIFLLALFSYLFLYGYLVIDVEHSDALYFPLWAEGELARQLREFPSRSVYVREIGRDYVFNVIHSSSRVPLLITTLVLLLIYQLIFVSLTFAFGILGIKSKGE